MIFNNASALVIQLNNHILGKWMRSFIQPPPPPVHTILTVDASKRCGTSTVVAIEAVDTSRLVLTRIAATFSKIWTENAMHRYNVNYQVTQESALLSLWSITVRLCVASVILLHQISNSSFAIRVMSETESKMGSHVPPKHIVSGSGIESIGNVIR